MLIADGVQIPWPRRPSNCTADLSPVTTAPTALGATEEHSINGQSRPDEVTEPAARFDSFAAAVLRTNPLRMGSRSASFGPFELTSFVHGPMICAPAADNFGRTTPTLRLLIVQSGTITLSTDSGTDRAVHTDSRHVLGPHEGAVIAGWHPAGYESAGPARIVTIDLHADHPTGVVPEPMAPVVSTFPGAVIFSPLGAFASDLLHHHTRELSSEIYAQITEMLDYICKRVLLTACFTPGADQDLASQRHYVERYIAARHADPRLSTTSVAEHLGISTRALQRLFEGTGSTLSREIDTRRLQQALQLLRDPRCARLPLYEIARLAGFRSVASMRRAVRCEAGLTPHQVRAEALAELPTGA